MQLHEQFIVDSKGKKKSVILPFDEYQQLKQQLKKHVTPAKPLAVKNRQEALAVFLAHNKKRNFPVNPTIDLSAIADQVNDVRLS